MTTRPFLTATLLVAALATTIGCGAHHAVMRPARYDVDVRIDPSTHSLEGEVELDLTPVDPDRTPKRRLRVDLDLHPELEVTAVRVENAELRAHRRRRGGIEEGGRIEPAEHRLILEDPSESVTVFLEYRGTLHQDVASGEEEGQIHNHSVSAHIGEEGLYLDPGGYWYPRMELSEDVDPAAYLADFRLASDPVEGFELVAGLERETTDPGGRIHWRSPFPVDGLVLLGGPLERFSRQHGDVLLHAVLAPGKSAVAADILDASAEYLDRYRPLIGPYPFREFTVLEAFFSSGFAFPTCTQIVGSQLSEHRQYRRHGYLDHELLHNWWGNGIYVDPRDGNWCEGLASYMGNYYGHVLDGDEKGARKQRRNQSNFSSSIGPEDDKPLGTFHRKGGAGSGIGYNKGAAVFHMLERRIGQEAMMAGLERLTAERMGAFTSWEDLQSAFEATAGENLDDFFEQWVRRNGAPLLELVEATWRPGASHVSVTISQGVTEFALDVPIRLHYGDRYVDTEVAIDRGVETVEVPCEPRGLTAVELDPDYHVFRKLKPEEVMPTSALIRRAETLTIVAPAGSLWEGYRVLMDSYERSVDDVDVLEPHEVDASRLRTTDVLVIGDAVRHPVVAAFLASTRSPVTFDESAFAVDEEPYEGAEHAVFFTVHHPTLDGHGVTVYYGNSEASLSNARVLSYYPNSLLVYETPLDAPAEDAGGMPRAKVVKRLDFEFHERIDF